MKPKVVQFSGGQTSGFLLRRLMDANPSTFDSEFIVCFENTGKEHNATLDFVHEVETKWGVKIVWLQYCRVPAINISVESIPEGRARSNLIKKQNCGDDAHWFKIVNYNTAARSIDKDTPFDVLLNWVNTLPNVQTRICSVQMKVRTRDRFLRHSGIMEFDSFIGIRADESDRVAEILANIDRYECPVFPLVNDGITKKDVDGWWDEHPFKLGIPNYLGNCMFCFLKKYWKRLRVAKDYPSEIEWAAQWEEIFAKKCQGNGSQFKMGETYRSILNDSRHPEFDFGDDDISCSCSIGGYRNKSDSDDD